MGLFLYRSFFSYSYILYKEAQITAILFCVQLSKQLTMSGISGTYIKELKILIIVTVSNLLSNSFYENSTPD